MQRLDIQHHQTADVYNYVAEALSMVEALKVPDDLRVAAFTQLVTMLSAKSVQLQAPQPVMMPSMAIPQGRRQ